MKRLVQRNHFGLPISRQLVGKPFITHQSILNKMLSLFGFEASYPKPIKKISRYKADLPKNGKSPHSVKSFCVYRILSVKTNCKAVDWGTKSLTT